MDEIEIPFRQWLPDQPDHNNPGLVEAKNVFRRNGAYQPVRDIQYPGGAVSRDLGKATSVKIMDVFSSFAAADEFYAFYEYTNSSTGNIFRINLDDGATFSTAVSAPGEGFFVGFKGKVYFISRLGEVFESPSSARGAFASVGVIPGSQYTCGAALGNFLMLGRRTGIKWSAFNDPSDWSTSELTQAGGAEVNEPELGYVTNIVGGRTYHLFQSYGLSRLTYVGPPKVWDVRIVSREWGAVEKTAIEVGGVTYFIGSNASDLDNLGGSGGFFVLKSNGANVQRVSSEKIETWLADNFTTSEAASGLEVFRRQVIWHSPSRNIIWSSGTGTGAHNYLCMNVDNEEFTYFEGNYRLLIPGPYHGAANAKEIMAIGENGGDLHYGPLSGDALEATLTTGHLASAGNRTFVDGIEPIYEGSGATVALSGKERIRDAASFSAYQAEESASGVAEITSDARSTAISVKFAAGETWSDFSGVVANVGTAGER